ncbi:tripartite tricarboxylate transporter permease [Pseudochelatococcus sp. B33]
MSLIENLALGFQTALSLDNVFYALIGCVLGTAIGVLPGLGPLATIAMLLPFTYGIEPVGALVMMAGIYYGSAYGGSTTAILVNLPGEASSVVTAIDGYQMARQGRAGVALVTAALSSFFAGCVGTLVLATFAIPLGRVALSFNSPEYFALMVLGLVGAASLSFGSALKSIGMILLGVLLGLVGTDLNTGVMRYTFGFPELWEGIDFTVVAVGIFAFGEVIAGLANTQGGKSLLTKDLRLWLTKADFLRAIPATLRGTGLGAGAGLLPGAGLSIASFFAYALEARTSKYRHELGKGAIEGVASPEAANNAAAQTAFVPTLTLGIPGSPTMALLLGIMTIHNIQPGPMVMTTNPALFWGLIASMWIGNAILVILNLPLVRFWVRVTMVPFQYLFPIILVVSCIGIFTLRYSAFDVLLAALFGLFGYLLRKIDCQPAPLMLGLVLGPMLEENFRRSLVISQGDISIFFDRPISLALLLTAALLIVLASLPKFRRKADAIMAEE